MLTRPLGNTGLTSSAVGLGTWNLGNQWGAMSDDEAVAIIDAALDAGITLLDTAESYGIPNGASELRIGRALRWVDRENVVLVSKIGNWGVRSGAAVAKTAVDSIRLCGHACAGRLGTRVDVMLCHEGQIEDPSVYIAGFEALKAEGFIRFYGISTNDLAVLRRFHERSGGACSVVEVDYSLLNRAPEGAFLDFCVEHGIGVLGRGPLAKGLLSGRYDADTVFTDSVREGWNRGQPGRAGYERQLAELARIRAALGDQGDLAQTALRFVLSHPAGIVVIPGATRPEQARANAAAGEGVLDEVLYRRLKAGN